MSLQNAALMLWCRHAMAQGRRKPRQKKDGSTDRRATTSARNGRSPKAGRPKGSGKRAMFDTEPAFDSDSSLNLIGFEHLPPPPREPLDIARWLRTIAKIDTTRLREGITDTRVRKEIRATITACKKLQTTMHIVVAELGAECLAHIQLDEMPADDDDLGTPLWYLLMMLEYLHGFLTGQPYDKEYGPALRSYAKAQADLLPSDIVVKCTIARRDEVKKRRGQAAGAPTPKPTVKRKDHGRSQRHRPVPRKAL